MTTLRLFCLSALLLGCGESAASESAPAATAAEATTAAPETPAAPAAPARIGRFGVFHSSVNTIEVNGHCIEIAANLPDDPAAAAEGDAALRAFAEHEARRGGPDAISDRRCPTEGRVAEVTGGCAMTAPMGAYVFYFYATGPHAYTADTARTECTQVSGEWID